MVFSRVWGMMASMNRIAACLGCLDDRIVKNKGFRFDVTFQILAITSPHPGCDIFVPDFLEHETLDLWPLKGPRFENNL